MNAFATVTSVAFPTRGAAGDTISVRKGAALGLDSLCDANSFAGFSGVTSSTFNTMTISLNTVVHSATLNGSTNQAIACMSLTFPTGRAWG